MGKSRTGGRPRKTALQHKRDLFNQLPLHVRRDPRWEEYVADNLPFDEDGDEYYRQFADVSSLLRDYDRFCSRRDVHA